MRLTLYTLFGLIVADGLLTKFLVTNGHALEVNPFLQAWVVQERLGHASITMTLDTYSHVAPGLQEAAANRFDDMLNHKAGIEAVERLH